MAIRMKPDPLWLMLPRLNAFADRGEFRIRHDVWMTIRSLQQLWPRIRQLYARGGQHDRKRHIGWDWRAHRLGRLRQGHLYRHGGDDAFGAGRRGCGRPD